jgi:hypothetical protein
MATENHPLLERAGIDDVLLRLDFREFGMVEAPDLTFQYSARGELDSSACMPTATPLCADAPALYRARFLARWAERGGEVCWERLRELVGNLLRDLPDNPFVLQKAWLVGLVDEMPAECREMLADLHDRIIEYRAEQQSDAEIADRARATGKPHILRTYVTDRCCNGNSDECSFDHATEYVLPDGSRTTEFRCCY